MMFGYWCLSISQTTCRMARFGREQTERVAGTQICLIEQAALTEISAAIARFSGLLSLPITTRHPGSLWPSIHRVSVTHSSSNIRRALQMSPGHTAVGRLRTDGWEALERRTLHCTQRRVGGGRRHFQYRESGLSDIIGVTPLLSAPDSNNARRQLRHATRLAAAARLAIHVSWTVAHANTPSICLFRHA